METSTTTTADELAARYLDFPDITFAEFAQLPERLREEIIQKNRIISTDTYNRTMCHIKGDEWKKRETYVLQMRRTAGNGYLIANGIRKHLEDVLDRPITQNEFDFAKEFYATAANVPFFNEEMWQSVLDNGGRLPIDVDAVPDGTAILEADPVMRLSGPGELVAHIEADMHRVFYETLVATTAHEIAEKVGANRFIEVGKRGTPNEAMHLQAASAMYDGGGIFFTSNDAAAAVHPELKDVGTIGHRYIQCKDTEIEAFRESIEALDAVTVLIDLTDSIRGIDAVIDLKEEFRATNKRIWIRLDSGEIDEQTVHALNRFEEKGFTDPVLDKVVVEDLSNVDEMVAIDDKVRAETDLEPRDHVLFGAGGLLVTKDKQRSNASTGFKLSAVEDRAKIKFSDAPGKESLPGEPTLHVEEDGTRIVGQVGEELEGADQLQPAVRNGEVLLTEDKAAVRAQVDRTYERIRDRIGVRSELSEQTQQHVADLKAHYQVA